MDVQVGFFGLFFKMHRFDTLFFIISKPGTVILFLKRERGEKAKGEKPPKVFKWWVGNNERHTVMINPIKQFVFRLKCNNLLLIKTRFTPFWWKRMDWNSRGVVIGLIGGGKGHSILIAIMSKWFDTWSHEAEDTFKRLSSTRCISMLCEISGRKLSYICFKNKLREGWHIVVLVSLSVSQLKCSLSFPCTCMVDSDFLPHLPNMHRWLIKESELSTGVNESMDDCLSIYVLQLAGDQSSGIGFSSQVLMRTNSIENGWMDSMLQLKSFWEPIREAFSRGQRLMSAIK